MLTETDEEGDKQRSYIYGNYIDEVLLMIDHTNDDAEYYYAHDHLFSPVSLMEDDGDVLERYEYDAYGKPYFMDVNFNLLEVQKSAYDNPYGFTGRNIDILDNGDLVKQHSRFRDLEYYMGRWFTPDPLGLIPNPPKPNGFTPSDQYNDGMSLYEYIQCDPISNVDPWGLIVYNYKKVNAGEYVEPPLSDD